MSNATLKRLLLFATVVGIFIMVVTNALDLPKSILYAEFAIGVLAPLAAWLVIDTRCPNCGKLFAGEVRGRQTLRQANRVNESRGRTTYQCRRCGEVWINDVMVEDRD